MNQIEKIFMENPTPSEFSKNYFDYLSTIFKKIDEKAIQKMVEVILIAREKNKTIFFIGNGGSAATASHFANDLAIGTRTSGKPFKVMSLTDNNAVLTAIGNDFGYENLFVKQLEAYLKDGDIIVAISASGNSPNIINAIEFGKLRNCTTIGTKRFWWRKIKRNS